MNISQYMENLSLDRKKIFFNEALRLGIKIEIISEKYRITKFSLNNKSFFMISDNFSLNTKTTAKITRNKEATKLILNANNISTPHGIEANTAEKVLLAIKDRVLKYPIVIKPIDSAKGAGVTMDINSEDEVRRAVNALDNIREQNYLMESSSFIAEEMVRGNDYRVLILNGEVIACVQRIPAHITGDGKKTIQELIKKFNETRPSNYLLNIDDDLLEILKEKKLTLEDVTAKGENLFLRKNANISSGGIAVDYTDIISKRFKQISIDAAHSINGTFVGIDLFVEDITDEEPDQMYNIIEINGAPDYDIHEHPVLKNSKTSIAKLLLEFMLQEDL